MGWCPRAQKDRLRRWNAEERQRRRPAACPKVAYLTFICTVYVLPSKLRVYFYSFEKASCSRTNHHLLRATHCLLLTTYYLYYYRLRVYLYREGFALFASDPYALACNRMQQSSKVHAAEATGPCNRGCSPRNRGYNPIHPDRNPMHPGGPCRYDADSADRYAFVTNAFVNRARTATEAHAAAAATGSARDAATAARIGLALPPMVQRWRLTQLEAFLGAQAATLCMCRRLQPYVPEAAILCAGGGNPICREL